MNNHAHPSPTPSSSWSSSTPGKVRPPLARDLIKAVAVELSDQQEPALQAALLFELGALTELRLGDAGKALDMVLMRFNGKLDPGFDTQWFRTDQIGVWNWSRWSDPEFDRLDDEAATTLEVPGRALTADEQKQIDAWGLEIRELERQRAVHRARQQQSGQQDQRAVALSVLVEDKPVSLVEEFACSDRYQNAPRLRINAQPHGFSRVTPF